VGHLLVLASGVGTVLGPVCGVPESNGLTAAVTVNVCTGRFETGCGC
jgi:hypothetical protein